ncbi:transposable element Tcb2 transposase [Trichonephila clavipes]|nr:transposable element Tcb2 transposase [Trichonephila clavipes]
MSTMSQRSHLTDSEAWRVVGSVNDSETPKYERYSSPITPSLGYWHHGFNSDCPKPAPWCRRIFIWRDRGSRNNPAFVHESVRFCGGGVLVYGGISIDGRTDLYIIRDGPLTARRYRDEVPRPIVVPYAAAIGDDFILMDNNSRPPHRANLVEDKCDDHSPRTGLPSFLIQLKVANGRAGLRDCIFLLASILFPPSDTITPVLAIWGGIATFMGGMMIVVHYSVIGKWLLANKIRRLKTSLREDLSYLKSLKCWFDRASLLKETTEGITGPHFKKSLPSKPASQVKEYLKWNTRCFTAAMCDNNNKLVDSLGFDLAAIVITFCVMTILRDEQNLETFRLAYVSTQMKGVFRREFLPSFMETSIISLLLNDIMEESNISKIISYVQQFTEQAGMLFNDWVFLNCIFNESARGM